MSTDRDTTRIVRSWLRADENESADRVLGTVLDRLDTTPQRRSTWWPARRLADMNNTAKLAVAAAAVIVVALVGIRYIAPGGLGVGSDPNATQTPSETASPGQVPAAEGLPLDAGRHSLRSGFPVEITFDLPAGWSSCSGGVLEQGVCRFAGTNPSNLEGIGVGFLIVENVVADPCNPADLLDPPVGPTIEDLATAISNLQGLDVSTAVDASVDGFDAKRLIVTAPENPACELSTWTTPDRTNGVGPGEANLLYLIDVDGVRVMINTTYFPSRTSDEDLAAAEELVASIDIEP